MRKTSWKETGGNIEYNPAKEVIFYAIFEDGKRIKQWQGLDFRYDDSGQKLHPTHYRIAKKKQFDAPPEEIQALLYRESELYKYIMDNKLVANWVDLATKIGADTRKLYSIFINPMQNVTLKRMLRLKNLTPDLTMYEMMNMLLPRERGWFELETWEHEALKKKYRDKNI